MPHGPTTRRQALSLLAVSAFALTTAACSEAPAIVPPDAPGVASARADAFTDAVRVADKQAQKEVLDQLASRFGRNLRILPRRVDSDAEPLPIKEHYEKTLVAARGWREFPLADYGSTWSFAFISPDSRQVFAVVVLNPRFAPEGGGDVPLTILTNLPDAGGR